MNKKPLDLQYGPDDAPPLASVLLAATQQVGLVAITLVVPLLLARDSGASPSTTAALMSLSMIALGTPALLQALRLAPVGSGYLAASEFSAIYIGPSVAAVRAGGLALAGGMAMIGGLAEILLSRVLPRLRPFLPPELAGLVIFLVGITTGAIGFSALFHADTGAPSGVTHWIVAAVTLLTMIVLNVWSKGVLRLACTLIGVIVGYALSFALGLVTVGRFAAASGPTLLALPQPPNLIWSFSPELLPAYLVAALAATLNAIGVIAACQRMTDANWIRPDLTSLGRGVFADGIGVVFAGFLGTSATGLAPASTSLAAATGVASRRVAYAISGILVVLAFVPPVTTVFILMPSAVVASVLLFTACFILLDGIEAITARLLDARRILTIGLAILAGMSVDMFPAAYRGLPTIVAPLFSSALVFGTLIGAVLNMVFRVGVRRRITLRIVAAEHHPDHVEEFLNEAGGAWGARRDVIQRAIFALHQLIEAVIETRETTEPIDIEASFDEFNLDLVARYSGPLLELPEQRPSDIEIRETEYGHRRLAGFMLRRNADRVLSSSSCGRCEVVFHFDH